MWEIVGTVFAILAFLLAAFTALRSKQVYKPILKFNNGLFYAYKNTDNRLQKKSTSTLIYGASVTYQNSEVIFSCIHLLINDSKLPIHDIILQLEYPLKHVVQNDDLEEENYIINEQQKTITSVKLMDFPTKSSNHREVQIQKSKAQVRYKIPSLRPRENNCNRLYEIHQSWYF